jgi:hypothetical protein
MSRIRTLFLLLTIIGPLHMGEQLMTSIEEFYMIRGLAQRNYYSLFAPSAQDHASVLLITIVWTVVSLMFYVLLREGMGRLLLVGFFGFFGVTEIHHVIESLMKGAYDPGVITCVPYAIVGGLLVGAVARELRGNASAVTAAYGQRTMRV